MLLRAILILLQRLPGCSRVVLVPAFVPSMFSMSRQQGKIRNMMQHRPNIEIFAKSLFSTPGIAQRTPLVCSMNPGRFTAFKKDEHNVESFSFSGGVMLLRAILILLQRLPGCSRVVLVPAFVPSMFSMSRQREFQKKLPGFKLCN